jgi:hypothetical protein
MKLEKRIVLFRELGKSLIQKIETEEFNEVLAFAKSKNGWFTIDNLKKSIQTIVDKYLNESELRDFVALYPKEYFEPKEPKKVGIVAAGNIPLVGFQDIIHVILTGHVAVYKASSQDEILIQYILKDLKSINPDIEKALVLADRLNNLDAYIATGSGNTSRYFDYYFGSKPNIIRKNRTSVAVLTGEENKIELSDLGNDIFSYFGLGCRNIAKLFVPEGYDFTPLFEAIEYWNTISMHSKYNNNYDYMKSIYLVNGIQHLDNGFLLIKNDENLASPISTLFYENYTDLDSLAKRLESQKEEIQVVVSKLPITENIYRFGDSQSPGLADYADNVDTIKFLATIAP